jgi:hypothetical protein
LRSRRSTAAWPTFSPVIRSFPNTKDPSKDLLRIASRARRTSPIGSDIADLVLRKVEEVTTLERAALLDAIDRLPAESEEESGIQATGHSLAFASSKTNDCCWGRDSAR